MVRNIIMRKEGNKMLQIKGVNYTSLFNNTITTNLSLKRNFVVLKINK